jgi:hypothetical protein
LYRSQQRTVQDRIRNYLQKYYPAAQEVSDAEVEKAGAKPGTAKYHKLKDDLITARLNTRKKPAPPEPVEPAGHPGHPGHAGPPGHTGPPAAPGRDRKAS